ncbi:MFS transporter [Pleomorphomonas carboxyditropha]|uniref:MFS transporter n=1 Tax=Pleomorphomonas carboxyditropha TaxID=2023338 RepID=A0A2G9WXF8_9HYPH|nr:MFS transporter [Pleomorphomonas carboxyditropha]PIO99349.1 MFS transporter [Pleomorphomonas carboxyditropha]
MSHPTSTNAFAHRPYVLYWLARLFATFAIQIVVVAVGWKVYDLTHDPMALGYVGLMQFLPAFLLVLITGTVADRVSRRFIIVVCFTVEAAAAVWLFALSWTASPSVAPIYLILLVLGVARAFMGPAMQSVVPNLVPRAALANAIGWVSSSWQVAAIGGPVAGGLLYGISEFAAFGTAVVLLAAAVGLMLALPPIIVARQGKESAWQAVSAGFRYVFSNRIVLGAISLDLFAVLLGGAVALMPVYASDILVLGPTGLGMMRAAPGVGAILVAAFLARFPIRAMAGVKMFLGVAVFGLATVVFGVSVTPWLSILCLGLMGAGDMISVYVRETLIQLATPDELRGRVSAVNMVFVGASNELGEFRAGSMAALIGTVPAVVFGGAGTLFVAGLWSAIFPDLRRAEKLDGS